MKSTAARIARLGLCAAPIGTTAAFAQKTSTSTNWPCTLVADVDREGHVRTGPRPASGHLVGANQAPAGRPTDGSPIGHRCRSVRAR
jgi:hypothetical protein